eukprot:TRINITY_DN22406_c0_g1_i1.p1 TRINITY_DN22406_c0_g1~~TRINITY_DN22406_c0_g1_i1.p1  ORF type:complete len:638 (-),score=154.19 TRINITY_DN22406_c0_g1_i1:51-1784(-)
MGKATTMHMLSELAKGNKDLFKGMSIFNGETPFVIGERRFSVVKFHLLGVDRLMTIEQAKSLICTIVRIQASQHQIELQESSDPATLMSNLLDSIYARERQPIVVLISGYDDPVIQLSAKSEDEGQEVATFLKPFFDVVLEHKNLFKAVLTGLSTVHLDKLASNSSAFKILSEDLDFFNLFGFTKTQLLETYSEFLQLEFEGQPEEILDGLVPWFGGHKIHLGQSDSDLLFNCWNVLFFLENNSLDSSTYDVDGLGTLSAKIVNGHVVRHDELFSNKHNTSRSLLDNGFWTIRGSDKFLSLGTPNLQVKRMVENAMVGTIQQHTSLNCWNVLFFLENNSLDSSTYDVDGLGTLSAKIVNGHVVRHDELFSNKHNTSRSLLDNGFWTIRGSDKFLSLGTPNLQVKRMVENAMVGTIQQHTSKETVQDYGNALLALNLEEASKLLSDIATKVPEGTSDPAIFEACSIYPLILQEQQKEEVSLIFKEVIPLESDDVAALLPNLSCAISLRERILLVFLVSLSEVHENAWEAMKEKKLVERAKEEFSSRGVSSFARVIKIWICGKPGDNGKLEVAIFQSTE